MNNINTITFRKFYSTKIFTTFIALCTLIYPKPERQLVGCPTLNRAISNIIYELYHSHLNKKASINMSQA